MAILKHIMSSVWYYKCNILNIINGYNLIVLDKFDCDC